MPPKKSESKKKLKIVDQFKIMDLEDVPDIEDVQLKKQQIELPEEEDKPAKTAKKISDWSAFLKKFREENKGKYKATEYMQVASEEYKKLKLLSAPPQFEMPQYKKYINSIMTNTSFDMSKKNTELKYNIEIDPEIFGEMDPIKELILHAKDEDDPESRSEYEKIIDAETTRQVIGAINSILLKQGEALVCYNPVKKDSTYMVNKWVVDKNGIVSVKIDNRIKDQFKGNKGSHIVVGICCVVGIEPNTIKDTTSKVMVRENIKPEIGFVPIHNVNNFLYILINNLSGWNNEPDWLSDYNKITDKNVYKHILEQMIFLLGEDTDNFSDGKIAESLDKILEDIFGGDEYNYQRMLVYPLFYQVQLEVMDKQKLGRTLGELVPRFEDYYIGAFEKSFQWLLKTKYNMEFGFSINRNTTIPPPPKKEPKSKKEPKPRKKKSKQEEVTEEQIAEMEKAQEKAKLNAATLEQFMMR